jgi:hypothetical protein
LPFASNVRTGYVPAEDFNHEAGVPSLSIPLFMLVNMVCASSGMAVAPGDMDVITTPTWY